MDINQSDLLNKTAAKSEHAIGVINIILGVVLSIDGILLAIMAFCCLLLSFSLFFMAAIPAFLVVGALCIVAFFAAGANFVTGIGTLVASNKGGKMSTGFSIATIVVDVAVIPANIIAFVCGVYLLYTEINFLSILIFIAAASAVILAAESLAFSIVRFVKNKTAVHNSEL